MKNLYNGRGSFDNALISEMNCIERGVGSRDLIGFDINTLGIYLFAYL